MHSSPRTLVAPAIFLIAMLSFYHWRRLKPPPRPSAKPTQPQTPNLKAAEQPFAQAPPPISRTICHTAHAQFAKLVHLAPKVAAGHTAFGTVLLAEGNARCSCSRTGASPQTRSAGYQRNVESRPRLRATSRLHQIRSDVRAVRPGKGPQTLTPDAAIAYATALTATSQPAAAQKPTRRSSQLAQPDNPTLHDALGTVLAQQEHYDDAASQFRQAISLDPDLGLRALPSRLGLPRINDPANAVTELTQANDPCQRQHRVHPATWPGTPRCESRRRNPPPSFATHFSLTPHPSTPNMSSP